MRQVCIVWLLDEMFCKCLNSDVSLLIFYRGDLSSDDSAVLKSPIITELEPFTLDVIAFAWYIWVFLEYYLVM